MELVQDISDYMFGIGNWLFAKYYLWVIVEGIIVPKHNGFKTNGDGLRKGFDNDFYQGVPMELKIIRFQLCYFSLSLFLLTINREIIFFRDASIRFRQVLE